MAVHDFSELAPETRAVVDDYVEHLLAGFCEVSHDTVEDVIADVCEHLLEVLDIDSTPEEARAATAELGEPDEYAEAMCNEVARTAPTASGDAQATDDGSASGTFLGMPYDFRMPTPERVQSRWWSPTNPKIMVPKAFGAGWTVNFGALAVKLHLIRPDDEDEPFASVPEPWVMSALAVPVAITAAIVVVWLAKAPALPAELPVHWDIAFRPDDFAPPAQALGFLLAMASIPTAWAIWSFATHRSRGARVLVSACAAFFAALAAGVFAATVMWAEGFEAGWALPVGIVLALLVPFGILVTLARINRRAEWRRDIGR